MIDDQRYGMRPAELLECCDFGLSTRPIAAFVTVLKQLSTAFQCLDHDRQQVRTRSIGDGIQAASWKRFQIKTSEWAE